MALSQAQSDSAYRSFERAVDLAGSQSEFARIVGCTPANIGQHLRARKLLPARFVIPAEQATGVSRHDLRPDLYPRENPSPAQHSVGQAPVGSDSVHSAGAPDSDPLSGMAA